MKKYLWRALLALLTFLCMAIIFGFSSQSAAESGSVSAIFSQPVTDLLLRLREGCTEEEAHALFLQVDEAIRTLAHFSEYALLGLLLHLTLRAFGARWWWLPWIMGTAYAVTDEWHQSFTPQRGSEWKDVATDCLGVLAGIILVRVIITFWREKHVQHS